MATRPTRVLIIEGDEDDDSLIVSYLGGRPGEDDAPALTHAPRLSTACHLLARQAFDAVLLDLSLPQTSGLEGFHRVRAVSPLTPVILLTGKRDEPLAARALKLGAQDYFIKGSPDCLLLRRAIRYAIERKRLSEEAEDLLSADDSPKLVLDSRNFVRFANPAVERVLGRSPSELVDKPFLRVLPPDGSDVVLSSALSLERRLRIRVSEISWHGEPARLVSMKEDAPPPEAPAFRDGRGEDLAVVDSHNHFLSRISHELRNTLATMKTAAYCLKDDERDKLSGEQTQLVDMISRNIDRQARIVENILDLSRFRSGKMRIRLQRASAATIIADLAEEYRMSRGPRMLEVRVDGGLPSIECDPDLIAQVLRNLIDNALRYARERIEISAARTGQGGVRISVTDDGTGIPRELLGGLFTQFHRLEESAGPDGHKGTGLGLAICREIVEGHHGLIRAENIPGAGARFSVELPARRIGTEIPQKPRPLPPGKRSYLLHK